MWFYSNSSLEKKLLGRISEKWYNKKHRFLEQYSICDKKNDDKTNKQSETG